MLLAFPVLILLAALLCLPPFFYARTQEHGCYWILFMAFPAIAVWVFLAGAGIGGQSLSNLVEVFWLLGGGVILAWLKVFVIDRRIKNPRLSTYTILALLCIASIMLRLFIPELPE